MRRVIEISAKSGASLARAGSGSGPSSDLGEELVASLHAAGFLVERCENLESACASLRAEGPVPVLLDTEDGHEVRALRALPEPPQVIAVVRSAEAAVTALRAGALYALRHPASSEEVVLHLNRLFDTLPKPSPKNLASSVMEAPPVLIGETMRMRSIKDRIRLLAQSSTRAFLIEGESGTGKDTVARAIHWASSPSQPFVYVNFWERSPAALEAELFGVESSAQGGESRPGLLELAGNGTLYLDEISLVPSSLQGRLLRLLREGVFRRVGGSRDLTTKVRIISSTSRDLKGCVRTRVLQAELVRRLSVSAIELPPLRDRLSDLPLLVRHFLALLSERLGRPISGVTAPTLNVLSSHRWPGNLRELANTLEREAIKSEGALIEIDSLPRHYGPAARVNYQLPSNGIVFSEFEREVLAQALAHAKGNQSRAASLLRISRDQLRYRMLKFGLRMRSSPPPASPELAPALEAGGE